MIASHYHEAFANRQEKVLPAFARDDFTRHNLREQRDVIRVDAHLALDARQRDHVDVVRVDLRVGRDDFQFQRGGHLNQFIVEG